MKSSYNDLLDRVRSVMKTWQDIDVINRIGLVPAEKKTELLGPIWLGVVCDEN